MTRGLLSLCAGLVLASVPVLARAEVSVHLDPQGHVRRVVYLTHGSGSGAVVWTQVRARLPIEVLLNPLGDNLGDLPPAIAINPATGSPWVVWPQNVGNQKRLVISTWNGKSWTTPVQIVKPDLLGSDQIEPRLLFDAAGVPYLFFTEKSRPSRILFLTQSRGMWTPAVPVSDAAIESWRSEVAFQGADLRLTYSTPTGNVVRVLSTTVLVDSATNLMDSPIPPGAGPTSPGSGTPGAPGGSPDDPVKHRK